MSGETTLFAAALACLRADDPDEKIACTRRVAGAFASGALTVDDSVAVEPIGPPGRPQRPRLVHARNLPQRGLGSIEGRAALLHAVAHIEFNAINLAWDAVHRFRGLPLDYYRDWIRVASDEARHFEMVRARLAQLGYRYGDFDAHDGLWDIAVRTADSLLERMALVPRVLEARGLDVTPGMIERLGNVGDHASVAILEVILDEEVAHVAAGTRWFQFACNEAGLCAETTFEELLARHMGGAVKGPFNIPARLAAGFSASELERLEARAA